MPITKCPKCEEEYDPVYSEHECRAREKQLGFGWGYGWIGLSVFNGFMATVGVIVFLIFLPKFELPLMSVWMTMLAFLVFLLLLGILIGLPIAQIIGLLQQKKWGLYLVYIGLGLGVLESIISLVGGTESFILVIIALAIAYLWFNYFNRRKGWFNAGKEEIPPPLPGIFPSSWNPKDTLTVIFLVLFLPVGLVLMWTRGWPRGAKTIITIISLFSFIVVSILALGVTLRFGALLGPQEIEVTREDVERRLRYTDFDCNVGLALTNGVYEGSDYSCDGETFEKVLFQIHDGKIAIGDLNNDGRDDVAVIIAKDYGDGRQVNYELSVSINKTVIGAEKKMLVPKARELLKGQPDIENISIENGTISLDLIRCCPEEKENIRYIYTEGNQFLQEIGGR